MATMIGAQMRFQVFRREAQSSPVDTAANLGHNVCARLPDIAQGAVKPRRGSAVVWGQIAAERSIELKPTLAFLADGVRCGKACCVNLEGICGKESPRCYPA